MRASVRDRLEPDGCLDAELIDEGDLGAAYRARRASSGGLVACKLLHGGDGPSTVRQRLDPPDRTSASSYRHASPEEPADRAVTSDRPPTFTRSASRSVIWQPMRRTARPTPRGRW